MGGVEVAGLTNVTIRFDGRLVFSDALDAWPRGADGRVKECLYFERCLGLTLTAARPYAPPLQGAAYRPPSPPASGAGVLDGQGQRWWGVPGVGYLVRGEDRPRLLHINACTVRV